MTTARLLTLLLLMVGCGASGPSGLTHVPLGTWGGDDAGLIVSATQIHAHIGCTKGDVAGSIPLDAQGRFDVEGLYNVDAYPVDRGILHPARFFGSTDGHALTLSVQLTDTGQTLGPVSLMLGREPGMHVCPICRVPPAAPTTGTSTAFERRRAALEAENMQIEVRLRLLLSDPRVRPRVALPLSLRAIRA